MWPGCLREDQKLLQGLQSDCVSIEAPDVRRLVFRWLSVSSSPTRSFKEPHPPKALPAQALRLALLAGETSTPAAELLATLVRYVVLKGGAPCLSTCDGLVFPCDQV